MSQVLISKIHCTLLANQKKDIMSSMYNNTKSMLHCMSRGTWEIIHIMPAEHAAITSNQQNP